jgi:hypothetical protein
MFRTILVLFVVALPLHAAEPTLGKLSEKYESGGRGPGTVSDGVGDPGGVSYGTYQLASKIGRADAFVKKYYAKEFEGLSGGSPEFTAKWKELARNDTAGLKANEHEYIRETHYQPQAKRLAKELGIDLEKRSATLRDVVWSTAVQHGPNTDVITTVAAALTADGTKLDSISDEKLIRAIYVERGRKTADDKLARFKGVSEKWIPALVKRFENELADALEMFKKE